MSPHCILCNLSFDSDESLQQHKRESPAHTFDCTTCNRHYGSGTALQQHLRDSLVHAPSFDCDDCDQSFDSKEALQQHLRDSLAHAPSFDYETCDRSFSNEEALEQHLRNSRITNRIQRLLQRPLWMSSSALSQRSIMTLLSHQLRCMPTCRDKKDGAVATPRQRMRGTDIKTRCKANCICVTVQRMI
jgi:hypothetical protein